MEAIYKLLREVKVLPPSPQVLPKVLDALHHEQTTLEEVGDLIALDPALTAKLLHYCNSGYFAGREPVASVPEAIGRVGFQTIFSLVSAVTSSKSFNLPDGSRLDGAQLWRHSLTTAFGCKFIAEDIGEDTTCCSPPACCMTLAAWCWPRPRALNTANCSSLPPAPGRMRRRAKKPPTASRTRKSARA